MFSCSLYLATMQRAICTNLLLATRNKRDAAT